MAAEPQYSPPGSFLEKFADLRPRPLKAFLFTVTFFRKVMHSTDFECPFWKFDSHVFHHRYLLSSCYELGILHVSGITAVNIDPHLGGVYISSEG